MNKANLAEPFIWDALVPDGVDPQTMLLGVVEEACGPLSGGVFPNDDWADVAGESLVLVAAAKDATCAQVHVAASIGNHQTFVEEALHKRARGDEDFGQDLHRLEVDAHIRRPSE